MTLALCLNCGATKFGAICPCPECKFGPTGDMNLDIAFSDHRMSKATLQAFGEVIRSIRKVCNDDRLRFWTFIYWVSTSHSTVIGVNLPAEQQKQYAEILAQAD